MSLPQDAPSARCLDDMKVGLRFTGKPHVVEEREIIAFAKQFDPQPFHTDPALASRTLFGGLIASGWHTAAMTMRLLLEAFPIGDGTIGLGGEVTCPIRYAPMTLFTSKAKSVLSNLRGRMTIVALSRFALKPKTKMAKPYRP